MACTARVVMLLLLLLLLLLVLLLLLLWLSLVMSISYPLSVNTEIAQLPRESIMSTLITSHSGGNMGEIRISECSVEGNAPLFLLTMPDHLLEDTINLVYIQYSC